MFICLVQVTLLIVFDTVLFGRLSGCRLVALYFWLFSILRASGILVSCEFVVLRWLA